MYLQRSAAELERTAVGVGGQIRFLYCTFEECLDRNFFSFFDQMFGS